MMHFGLVVGFFVAGLTASFEVGFRVAITEKGFSYMNELGCPILRDEIENHELGGDISGRLGLFDYRVSKIVLTQFKIDNSSVKTSSSGITVKGSGITIRGTADWHWQEETILGPGISDSGYVDLYMGSVSFDAIVTAVRITGGKLEVNLVQCSLSIPNFDVHFHGHKDSTWFYNLFRSEIGSIIKKIVEKEACKEIEHIIETKVAVALDSLPVEMPIADDIMLSYELQSNPDFSSHYVYTLHKGEFLMKSNPVDAPFSPTELPPISSSLHKMMYLWVTDYVPNTAGLVFQKAGILQHTITSDMVPKDYKSLMNTSYYKWIVPALYMKYPNMEIEIYVNTTKSPWVQVAENNANVSISGTVRVTVIQPNKTKVNAFTLGIAVQSDAFVWINNINGKPRLSANCSDNRTKFTFSLVSSNIGDIDVKLLQDAVNIFVKAFVIPVLNKYGNSGLALPIVDGLSFINPEIILIQNCVIVGTDFKYEEKWSKK